MVWRAWGDPLAWIFGVAAALGLIVFFSVVYFVGTGSTQPFTFGDISDSSSDVLGHIGSYLAVAVIDPSASTSEAILAFAVFGLIFLIHVSVGLVHVNPLFYVIGYRVYSGSSDRGRTYYLIVKSDVADWEGVQSLVRMTEGILLEKRYAPGPSD